MDRISDSGSEGCGSIPHGGTKKDSRTSLSLFLYLPGCALGVSICTNDQANGSIRDATSWHSEA